jgi:hypothetical protein
MNQCTNAGNHHTGTYVQLHLFYFFSHAKHVTLRTPT